MTEFLTENARRAYPLEREWPSGMEAWAETLVDACVYASSELGESRLSLLSVGRSGSSLVFTVGIPGGAAMDVAAPSGHAGFTTVHAESADLKAILTVDGQKVDALVAAATVTAGDVGVPFATRCCGGATRRVTAITAQGAAPRERLRYNPRDPHMVEKPVGANEHAVIAAYDGIDLEVTSMLPLAGDILRISAIAAPEAADVEQEPIDLMIRGDECFEVEAVPSADRTSGTVKITSTCKPCCDCEDYRDAVNMLRPAENAAHALHAVLNRAKAAYAEALAAFNAAKAGYVEQINRASNVRVSATAALSGGLYGGSTARGTRKRIAVTLLVENMTMATAYVTVGDDVANSSGFTLADSGDGPAYTHLKTVWTKGGATQAHGSSRPGRKALAPGETLTVVATYAKAGQLSNNATRPATMKAYCAITLDPGDLAPEPREVDIK